MSDANDPTGAAQQLDRLSRQLDALWAHTLSMRVQFDLLLMAIERADFRMRGFNPILDAVDLLHRDLIAQLSRELSEDDQHALDHTRLLLDACEKLRQALRMD